LGQIGLDPAAVIPADIDETPRRGESPRALVQRLASEKAAVAARVAENRDELGRCLVLAADTVVCVGRRALPKCEVIEEAATCLRILSGRAHRVYTAIALSTPSGSLRRRLVEARVRFKRLSRDEIDAYLASGEWRGKAGGYAIQGFAGAFVVRLVGSYTCVVGLPLVETMGLLAGEGLPAYAYWPADADAKVKSDDQFAG
jgi:septum formation protein